MAIPQYNKNIPNMDENIMHVDMPDIRQHREELMEQEMPQQLPSQMPIPQQHQVQRHGNPFASEMMSYGVPDTPIQYGGGMAEVLLNDTDVPEAVKKKWWFVFNKDNILTFLDEDRKRSKMLNFDIIKIDILNSLPYYDYNFDFELQHDILRNVFETKLDRALGFKGQNVKNERIVLQSQFSENRQIQEQGDGSHIKEGFFKRLLGRR